jgi:hypothetical protein
MAHFAKLDEKNLVLQVIVIDNDCLLNAAGKESESTGIEFCNSLFGESATWKQTSYNGTIRKNFAGVGYTYNPELDAFIPPKPYPSWVLNQSTARWEPPIPYPPDGRQYLWSEQAVTWIDS